MPQIFLLIFACQTLLYAHYSFTGEKYSIAQDQAQRILTIAYQRAGIAASFRLIDKELALQESNSGRSDGEIARIKTIHLQYPNLERIDIPITTVDIIVVSKNGAPFIDSFEALQRYNFGLLQGSKLMERLSNAPKSALFSSYDELFEALNSNQIDYILIQKKTAIYYLKLHHLKHVQFASKTLKRVQLYHWVHTKNHDLIPIIYPILKQMQQSGEIAYLQRKFLLELLATH